MSTPRSLKARVVEVVAETADACSFVLEPASDEDARGLEYRCGQFLTVQVPTERPEGAARCYSLSSSPVLDERPKVTVKRTPDGYASNWLCDNVVAGTHLEILRPGGTFTPHSLDDDLLLIAAGSGITPVMSILKSCLHGGTGDVVLVYANRDEESVIFREELQALAGRFGDRLTTIHWLETVQGRPTAEQLRGLAAPYTDREAFVCGPGPFMDVTLEALDAAGMPRRRVHVERFYSLTADPFAEPEVELEQDGPASTVEVELDGETHTLRWPEGAKLLDVLLDAGLDAPYSCREGNCSACACILQEGEVDMERNEVLEEEDLAEGFILGCQALARTDQVKVSYDE